MRVGEKERFDEPQCSPDLFGVDTDSKAYVRVKNKKAIKKKQ